MWDMHQIFFEWIWHCLVGPLHWVSRANCPLLHCMIWHGSMNSHWWLMSYTQLLSFYRCCACQRTITQKNYWIRLYSGYWSKCICKYVIVMIAWEKLQTREDLLGKLRIFFVDLHVLLLSKPTSGSGDHCCHQKTNSHQRSHAFSRRLQQTGSR